jgi:hypothetical protein
MTGNLWCPVRKMTLKQGRAALATRCPYYNPTFPSSGISCTFCEHSERIVVCGSPSRGQGRRFPTETVEEIAVVPSEKVPEASEAALEKTELTGPQSA